VESLTKELLMTTVSHSARRRRVRVETGRQLRVLQVAKVISATMGDKFFRCLTEHLSRTLVVDCAYLAKLTGPMQQKLSTLSAYRDGAAIDNFEQDRAGTASSQVLTDGAVSLAGDASRVFPLDPLLEELSAEGFVGVRLCDSAGQTLGLLAVVNRARLQDSVLVSSVLQTFAPRAAAELERTMSYDTLRESEERYRAFISSSFDGMWRVELELPVPLRLSEEEQIERIFRDGYVAECNEAMARIAGVRSPEELVGMRFEELFSRSDVRVREELRLFVSSGYTAAVVQTTPLDNDGKQLYRLRTQHGIVQGAQLLRIWGTTRDITDLKRAELAAESSERRFREVLEKIEFPAVILNVSGVVEFCNDTLLSVTGLSRTEVVDRNWVDVITDSAVERERWHDLLSGQADSAAHPALTTLIRLPERANCVIIWNTIVLADDNGAITGLAAIGRLGDQAGS
jgi:two-component system, cell cycle sensor histidine kinase and response regulator CckA